VACVNDLSKIWKSHLQKVNSIPDVFINKTPSLALIKKDYGDDFMLNFLTLWLFDQNTFAGGKMTETELKTSANIIFSDYYHLTIGDLKLISQRLRQRKFIRVSGNEFYREIELYFNDRCEIATSLTAKNTEEIKEESENTVLYSEFKKMADSKNLDNLLGIKSEQEKQHEAVIRYSKEKEQIKKESETWNKKLKNK